jgi:uncharacterized delta-60 repeat protein
VQQVRQVRWTTRVLVAVALLALCALAWTAIADGAAGDPDPTFGTGGTGRTIVPLSVGNDEGNASLVLSDGKIVVVGADAGTGDMAIMRFTEAGALDPAFGDGGITRVNVAGVDVANDVALQSDGKLVVVGTTNVGTTDADIAVVRLTAAGALDTTFDSDGKVTIDFSGADAGEAILVEGTNIIVAGSRNGLSNPAVAKLNSNGALVEAFGAGGKTSLSGIAAANGMRVTNLGIQNNGKLLLSGQNGGQLVAVRLNADGTGDNAFSGDGYAVAPKQGVTDEANAAVATSGGVVTVAGRATGPNNDIVVARFTNNGSLDTTFSGDGVMTIDTGSLNDVANDAWLLGDGSLLIAGGNGDDTVMAQVTPQGTLDPTFGTGGISVKDASGAGLFDEANGIDLQPNNLIVLAFDTATPSNGIDPGVLRLQGPSADLGMTVVDKPDPGVTGSVVTFTATITNVGSLDQTATAFSGVLPTGATAVTSTSGACTTSPVACSIGNVAPGGVVTVTVTMLPTVSGLVTTTFTVTGANTDLDQTNNTVAVQTRVRQKMALTLRERTKAGKLLRCGATVKGACRARQATDGYFGGALAPASKAKAGQVVTLRWQRKVGSKWVLKKTTRAKLTSKKTYSYRRTPSVLTKGTWRVRASVGPTTTTSAATSRFRYLVLT